MKRDAKVGDIASPDLYFAALWAGPAFFSDPRTAQASAGEVPGSLPGMRSIDSTTDLRQAAAEARGTGATAIKLYAALSPELVVAATAEGHRQGMLVWAHAAMAQVSPLQMTEAGVDALSHATLVARQLGREGYAALVKDSAASMRGPVRHADLRFALRRPCGGAARCWSRRSSSTPRSGARSVRWPMEITRRAHQLGVTLLAGTDSLGSGDEGAVAAAQPARGAPPAGPGGTRARPTHWPRPPGTPPAPSAHWPIGAPSSRESSPTS